MSQGRGDSVGFGDELADLSEAELAERANESVQEFHNRYEKRADDYLSSREGLFGKGAESYLSERESAFGGRVEGYLDSRESAFEERAGDYLDSRRGLFGKAAESYLSERESAFGGFVDTDISQTGGSIGAGFGGVSGDSQLGQAKGEMLGIIAQNPGGVRFSEAVKAVLGEGAVSNATYGYQQLKDWVAGSEYVQTSKNGGIWVQPSLNLRQQYAKRKTSAGRGDGDAQRDGRGDGRADSPQYPKDRVRAVLDKYLQFPSDSVKQSFLREFVTERGEIDDKWKILRHRVRRDDYLCLPWRTRHNDGVRAGDVRDGFEHALQAASGRHNRAVMLTVTTDPKQHDSLTAALNSLAENKGRLLSWLATEYQLGYRPENLSALEFSRNGLPHYHIVLFGISWAVTQERLSAQWQSYGQGKVVDCRTAETAHDGTQWLLHDDSQGKVSLSYYLGKAIRGLEDIAEMGAGDLEDRVDGGDISLWRQVLYWATGRQYYSCSPSLKRPTPDDDLPQVTVWEFVGAAQYGDIPAHVRRGARFAGLPPPATSRTGSAAG